MGEFFVGVDLGQARDFTAIAVIERVERKPTPERINAADGGLPPRRRKHFLMDPPDVVAAPVARPVTQYDLRHCERPRLGTPYPDVVRRVREVLERAGRNATLVVDATGVGRPVVDLFEAAGAYPIAVTLTAGDAVAHDRRSYRVPKRDLVATLEILLQERRLKIAHDMVLREALVDELLAFRANVSPTGHDSFAAAAGVHDDLVIAVALACWRGREAERDLPRAVVSGLSEPWEDRDDPDALWLGDPQYRYAFGYHGGGSRFIGGGFGGPSVSNMQRLRRFR